ncbi:sulfatase-like hydrolase/transferase [Synechococcus sp. 1G10]|uniref:sulfatase-like hydrolase/transferase n=1 Tax=Synechococcus sp. 1G10 TaxID=2025605 RepID=UPI000B9803D7|nr:sulfatase-like hydrolase/transferase [Synechococcus sp. 1G10]
MPTFDVSRVSASDSVSSWLLISFDQWRGDWLLQPWLQLPHLRSLVANGWLGSRCYTPSPQCVPARASWLTGLRPSRLGLDRNRPFTMPPDAPSFVRDLQEHGYVTSLVGKTHWTPHHHGVELRDNIPLLRALGFDRAVEIAGPRALAEVSCALTDAWRDCGMLDCYREDLTARYANGRVDAVWPTVLPEALYPDLWLGEQALKELAVLPDDMPWFLWVSFPGPHEPFDVPSSWRQSADQTPIPAPVPRPPEAEMLPVDCQLSQLLRRWPDGFPPESLLLLRQDYANHLALLDAQVGALLAALQARPDGHRVAVTVISDHGELLGDWGLMLKGCFLEGAVRSLFIHQPPGGRRQDESPGSERPIAATPALHSIARGVTSGARLEALERLAGSTGAVESEFAGERLQVRECQRLLIDSSGRPYGYFDVRGVLHVIESRSSTTNS